jgi:predicted GH43/DUF377 family glycosyl hydrolase
VAVNPILSPSATAAFRSPMNDSLVRVGGVSRRSTRRRVVRDGKVYVLYRAEDATGASIIGGHTSRIGLAESRDGGALHAAPGADPLSGERWAEGKRVAGGAWEDPRIVEDESGRYVLTYTQWNRQVPRLAVATSRDLVRWGEARPRLCRCSWRQVPGG